MRLDDSTPEKKSLLKAAAGCLWIFAAMALLWGGLCSVMTGWAYQHQSGWWTPLMVGLAVIVFGFGFLVKGVSQYYRNVHGRKEYF